MTTRVLDIQAGILAGERDGATPYADLTWTGVLRSLSAHQMLVATYFLEPSTETMLLSVR
jgi:hypothetical protein